MFKTNGVKVTCPNCGGHTRVVGKYGECDYCGGLIKNPIPQIEIQPTKQESKARFQSRREMQEIEEILRKAGRPVPVSYICEQMLEPTPVQKCSAFLRRMIEAGIIERVEEKRKVCFVIKGA